MSSTEETRTHAVPWQNSKVPLVLEIPTLPDCVMRMRSVVGDEAPVPIIKPFEDVLSRNLVCADAATAIRPKKTTRAAKRFTRAETSLRCSCARC